jgi:quercetin dioxygenase-like cupin family protein
VNNLNSQAKRMKRLLITVVLLGALGTAAAALAAGQHPITAKVLGAASVAQPYSFQVQHPADVVVAKATVPPGASFGWHSHRAAAVAIVKSGTLSLYDGADPTCAAQRYSAGKGFVEQPGHVHLARNEGHRPVVVLVTYLGLKHGVNPDVPAARPGNCPF